MASDVAASGDRNQIDLASPIARVMDDGENHNSVRFFAIEDKMRLEAKAPHGTLRALV